MPNNLDKGICIFLILRERPPFQTDIRAVQSSTFLQLDPNYSSTTLLQFKVYKIFINHKKSIPSPTSPLYENHQGHTRISNENQHLPSSRTSRIASGKPPVQSWIGTWPLYALGNSWAPLQILLASFLMKINLANVQD